MKVNFEKYLNKANKKVISEEFSYEQKQQYINQMIKAIETKLGITIAEDDKSSFVYAVLNYSS